MRGERLSKLIPGHLQDHHVVVDLPAQNCRLTGGFPASRLLAARSKSSSKGSALQAAWRSPSR